MLANTHRNGPVPHRKRMPPPDCINRPPPQGALQIQSLGFCILPVMTSNSGAPLSCAHE
jgi:hypothetical protein